MKKLLLITLVSLCFSNIKSQDFPKNANGEVEFTEVIETNLSKAKLYSNAQEWIAKTFGDYKSVIQLEDNENGKLIIKGNSNVNCQGRTEVMQTKEKISYTLTIEVKEGKYRYKVDNVFITQSIYALGSTIYSKPFSPLEHLELMAKYSKELDSLQKVDITKMKKKLLTEHQEKITINENYLKNENLFYKDEYTTIVQLIDSLKKSILINDDF
ncbi:MAG TPA: DUF4468 domain-containing protein [Tenuifilaceae bacterium]|nr:DUF4468 domain-containing protein [Tenuifilaceae bacterium]